LRGCTGNFAVSVKVQAAGLDDSFKFLKAILCDENIVGVKEIRQVYLLAILDGHIFEISGSKIEILVLRLSFTHECKTVNIVWSDNFS
jgi:hypothetical protein